MARGPRRLCDPSFTHQVTPNGKIACTPGTFPCQNTALPCIAGTLPRQNTAPPMHAMHRHAHAHAHACNVGPTMIFLIVEHSLEKRTRVFVAIVSCSLHSVSTPYCQTHSRVLSSVVSHTVCSCANCHETLFLNVRFRFCLLCCLLDPYSRHSILTHSL